MLRLIESGLRQPTEAHATGSTEAVVRRMLATPPQPKRFICCGATVLVRGLLFVEPVGLRIKASARKGQAGDQMNCKVFWRQKPNKP
jgi:hypothetical protein